MQTRFEITPLEQQQFGRVCDDYVKWSDDPKRPRTTFYGSEGDLVTMVTCVPEHVLKYFKWTPSQPPLRITLEFTAANSDSQGKPVVACVLSVKKESY